MVASSCGSEEGNSILQMSYRWDLVDKICWERFMWNAARIVQGLVVRFLGGVFSRGDCAVRRMIVNRGATGKVQMTLWEASSVYV